MKVFLESLSQEIKYTQKKLGLLIIFFIGMPFLTVWFAGAYYHEYVNDVSIVVLDEDNTSLSRKIVKYFDDSERFNVAYNASSREELQQLIDEQKAYMGIYIPPHLNDQIKTGGNSEVLILTNGANVVIGNNVYAGAAEIIQTVSAGVSIKVIEGKGSLPENVARNIALSFQFRDRMLYDSKLTYINYLMYGFVAVFFQQLMLSAMATLVFRNPEEVAKENTFTRMLAKIMLASTLLMATGALAMYIIHTQLNVVFDGNILLGILMAILFGVAISCPAIILCALTKTKTRFTQVSYMLSLPTFLTCGYVWPLDQMPKVLSGVVKLIWPLVYFARPFDEIMIKHLSFGANKQNMIGLILYSAVFMPLALYIFKKQFTIDENSVNIQNNKAYEDKQINV